MYKWMFFNCQSYMYTRYLRIRGQVTLEIRTSLTFDRFVNMKS